MTKTIMFVCFVVLIGCASRAGKDVCSVADDCLGGELCGTEGQCVAFRSLQGPLVTVTAPAASSVTGATYVFTGTTSDPAGIATLTLAGIGVTSTDAFATWSIAMPLTVGANAIPLHAEDFVGKVVDQSLNVTRLDAEGPVITWNPFSVDTGAGIPLNGTVTDATGVSAVMITVSGFFGRGISSAYSATVTGNTWSAVGPPHMSDCQVSVSAEDVLGNVSSTESRDCTPAALQ